MFDLVPQKLWFDSAAKAHAYHLYVIRVEDRKGLYDYLRENRIFAQVHYVPLNTMPYYRSQGSRAEDCPVASDYYGHCLSLPMFPTLTDEEQEYVIGKVKEYVLNGRRGK